MIDSLYIHIPFCRKKCIYCDFYSVNYEKALASSYLDALSKQIDSLDLSFSTIYIGGGTPSVMDLELLRKLLISLRRVSKKTKEFTIEANPESIDKSKIRLFLKEGVNRLSFGMQSGFDEKLKKLTRIHSSAQARQAVFLAKKEGFKNISIDLIFGVEGENLPIWKKELQHSVRLPITHISAYSLTYEEKTPLYKKVAEGKLKPLKDELLSQMYKFTMDYLPKRGFFQYEVSNFAKLGYACLHNLNYWENNSYLGLGPSATSYIGGVRSKNISCVKEYIRRVNFAPTKGRLKKGFSLLDYQESLAAKERAKETAALKIRCKEGIDFKKFREKTGFDFWELENKTIGSLSQEGLIKVRKNKARPVGLCLTKKGFLFGDRVSAAFL